MIRILAAALGLFAATPAAAQPVVNAPAGSVRGEALDGVSVYRGLPYARPPVGRLRWRPPTDGEPAPPPPSGRSARSSADGPAASITKRCPR